MSTPEAILDRARDLHSRGDLDRAVKLYRQGLASRPRLGPAWYLLGLALRDSGLLAASAEALRTAVSLVPLEPDARRELAAAERRLGRMDASLEVYRDWARMAPASPEPARALVADLTRLLRVDDALAEARAALARFPDDPPLLQALARIAERRGLHDEARAAAERLLAACPRDPLAPLILARLESAAGRPAESQARLRAILDDPGADPDARALAMLETAARLDRAGDPAGAFDLAARGKRLLFERLPPEQRDLAAQPARYDRLRRALNRERIAAWPEPPPLPPGMTAPVFIVGFPRTGTTLLEQILAAHPGLLPTDELQLLQPVRDLLAADFAARRAAYPDWLGSLTPAQIDRARRAYFERARWHLGPALDPGGRRLVDKHPLNTADLCLVRRLFPDAPVIVALRDPRDTCLSCFFSPLRDNPAFYDLRTTAELYAAAMSLWLHYREVLGLRAMELRYEDLVADTPAVARRVLEFIGEPWTDEVLAFHQPRHRRFVATPSYQDVARPVYASAVARWRRHEDRLRPLDPILRPYIDAFGYA